MPTQLLTPKQEKFAVEYVRTGSATEAYRAAYVCDRMKPESVHRLAHAQLHHVKIASRIKELTEEANQPAIADTYERQRLLTSIMRDTDEPAATRIHACDRLSKMQGDYLTNIRLETQEPGIMLVPVIGDGSLEDWERMAKKQQAKLKAEVRK